MQQQLLDLRSEDYDIRELFLYVWCAYRSGKKRTVGKLRGSNLFYSSLYSVQCSAGWAVAGRKWEAPRGNNLQLHFYHEALSIQKKNETPVVCYEAGKNDATNNYSTDEKIVAGTSSLSAIMSKKDTQLLLPIMLLMFIQREYTVDCGANCNFNVKLITV